MKRLLVLTAGFGDGHNTAAKALKAALEEVDGSAEVEVVDLLQEAYGSANEWARYTYHGLINHTPAICGGLYHTLDRAAQWSRAAASLMRARVRLAQRLADSAPDCVIATYPLYASLIRTLYPDPGNRPFRFGVVITDSVTVNSSWTTGGADFFCVPNKETAAVLESRGVEGRPVVVSGFPVSPRFGALAAESADWEPGQVFRVLYVLNHGSRKALKTVRQLLKAPGLKITVVAGRNRRLEAKLRPLARERDDERMVLMGWTDQIPELMAESHLVLSKAGGATLQEALAAGRPVIVTQVVPGQEVGNATLVESLGLGAVVGRPKEIVRTIREALKHRGRTYRLWRRNVERNRRPEAAYTIAHLLLACCEAKNVRRVESRKTEPNLTHCPAVKVRRIGGLRLCYDTQGRLNYRRTASQAIRYLQRLPGLISSLLCHGLPVLRGCHL